MRMGIAFPIKIVYYMNMEKIDFENCTAEEFAKWILDSFRIENNFYEHSTISYEPAFDFRKYGIPIGTCSVESLPMFFNALADSDKNPDKYKLFENGMTMALESIDPEKFPSQCMSSIISVVGSIHSKKILDTLCKIYSEKSLNEKYPNFGIDFLWLFRKLMSFNYNKNNNADRKKLDRIYSVSMDFTSADPDLVTSTLFAIIRCMPHKWADTILKLETILREIKIDEKDINAICELLGSNIPDDVRSIKDPSEKLVSLINAAKSDQPKNVQAQGKKSFFLLSTKYLPSLSQKPISSTNQELS